MAVLTTYAVIPVEGAGLLSLRDIERMARHAAGRGFGLKVKNATHPFADVAGEGAKGMCVFVLHRPGAIFVLQHSGLRARLYATVATGGTAGARSGVLRRCIGCPDEGYLHSKHKYRDYQPPTVYARTHDRQAIVKTTG